MINLENNFFIFDSDWSSSKRNGGRAIMIIALVFLFFDLFLYFNFGVFLLFFMWISLLLLAVVLLNIRVEVRVSKDVVERTIVLFFYRSSNFEKISQYRYLRLDSRPPPVTDRPVRDEVLSVDLCVSKTPYWNPGDFDFYKYISFRYDIDPEIYFSFVDSVVSVTGREVFTSPDFPIKFKELAQERYGDV